MKTIDIFIKSYKPDFWLLNIALETIKKNVTGYSNLILIVPEQDKQEFETRNLPERTLVHYVPEQFPGYLWQQVCKIKAHKYSYADYIMYSDSDALCCDPVNLQDLIADGKPEILFTDYEKVPDAKIWREPTEKLIGDSVPWEYMRRLGLIYHRETIVNLNDLYPNIENIIMGSQRFSEFNFLGAYANKFENEKYKWTNTDFWEYVPPVFNQVWSHATKDEGSDTLHLREYIRTLETIMKAFNVPTP